MERSSFDDDEDDLGLIGGIQTKKVCSVQCVVLALDLAVKWLFYDWM